MTKTIFSLAFLAALNVWAGGNVKPIKEVFEPKGQFKKEEYVKVAVVQWAPHGSAPLEVSQKEAEEWKQSNREALEQYIREAAKNGAEMVLTPEFGVVGYPDIPSKSDEDDNFENREQVKPYIEKVPGPTSKFFGRLAKELGIYIHVGFAEDDGGTYYNTVIVLGPKGDVITKYHKNHLFQVEEDFLTPGTQGATYMSPAGKVGIIICSDVYSSSPISEYVQDGVDILALSTSWAQANTGWSYFTRAAQDANMFLLASNQSYFPDSGVINRDGSAQSHIRQSEGIAYGYLPRVDASK